MIKDIMTVNKKAFAKINLSLEILGLRSDSYHEIRTCMLKIPMYDELTISIVNGNGIELNCSDKFLCKNTDNLAYRAADIYMKNYHKKTAKQYRIEISLKKTIPFGAGLAGGSADGAAVLDALNFLIGEFCPQEIEKMAAELGSDVPFCLEKYKCAFAVGRGIELTPLPSLLSGYILVAMPHEKMSTKEIYSQYDKRYPEYINKEKSEKMAQLIKKGCSIEEILPYFVNDFEEICFEISPEILHLKEYIYQAGAIVSQMTGSGSAVFGLFDNNTKIINCKEKLNKLGYLDVFIYELNKFPL